MPSRYAPVSNEQTGSATLLKRDSPLHEEQVGSTTLPNHENVSDMRMGDDDVQVDADDVTVGTANSAGFVWLCLALFEAME